MITHLIAAALSFTLGYYTACRTAALAEIKRRRILEYGYRPAPEVPGGKSQ